MECNKEKSLKVIYEFISSDVKPGTIKEFFSADEFDTDITKLKTWDYSIKTELGHFWFNQKFFVNRVLGNYQVGVL